MNRAFFKLYLKTLMLTLAAIAACQLTRGYAVLVLLALCFAWGANGKIGKFMAVFMMIPFMTMLNAVILTKTPVFSYGARAAVFLGTGMLVLQGMRRRGGHSLPLGTIFFYLAAATLSSVQGYFPMISYLKIVNFAVFVLGLYIGSRAVTEDPGSLNICRAAILSFVTVMILGSAAMIPFPSISLMSAAHLVRQGYNDAQIKAFLASSDSIGLLCGAAFHSQTLAALLACMVPWTVCDMLFVERKFTRLHGLLVVTGLPLMYMTRSRIVLFSFAVFICILVVYCLPKIRLPVRVKSKIIGLVYLLCVLLVVGVAALELKSAGLSRWLRKTETLSTDNRTLGEAVTASRQSSIEANLYDFNRNRLLGSGFQVIVDHPAMYQAGMITLFSAPIEKGLLPLMVLGETGILGAVFFAVFLFAFYFGCMRRKYYVTLSLFTVFLAVNMAEAIFFSPNGGGFEWLVTVFGGYIIDVSIISRRRHEGMVMMMGFARG